MDDKISVLMCVFNTKKEYLQDAVNSILRQDYKNIEFIIVDDCSTNPETLSVLKNIKDRRVQIIYNKSNQGLTKSLNIGLKYCTGKYLARMDSDDISSPHRLSRQLEYLKENKFEIIGSVYDTIPSKRKGFYYTEDLHKQKIRMIFGNAGIVHSSAFISLDFLRLNSIHYDEKYKYAQDYALWCEFLSRGIPVGCCRKKLIKFRISDDQISTKLNKEQNECAQRIREEYLKNNFIISDEDAKKFVELVTNDLYKKNVVLETQDILERFIATNINSNSKLSLEIYRFWLSQTRKGILAKNYKLLFCKIGLKSINPKSLAYYFGCRRKEHIQ